MSPPPCLLSLPLACPCFPFPPLPSLPLAHCPSLLLTVPPSCSLSLPLAHCPSLLLTVPPSCSLSLPLAHCPSLLLASLLFAIHPSLMLVAPSSCLLPLPLTRCPSHVLAILPAFHPSCKLSLLLTLLPCASLPVPLHT